MRRYLCGVPKSECTGAECQMNRSCSAHGKVHATREDAFKCYTKYLESLGYQRLGAKEYWKEGGPILLLTKKSKFGGMLRGGKSVKGVSNKRCIPSRGKGAKGGLILSN